MLATPGGKRSLRGRLTVLHVEPDREGMHGYSESKGDYLVRLRRIEGQVRGLQRMVEEDAYCIDVLTQVSSVTRALQKVALALLDEHMEHCVRQAVEEGGPQGSEKIAEAMAAVERLVRS